MDGHCIQTHRAVFLAFVRTSVKTPHRRQWGFHTILSLYRVVKIGVDFVDNHPGPWKIGYKSYVILSWLIFPSNNHVMIFRTSCCHSNSLCKFILFPVSKIHQISFISLTLIAFVFIPLPVLEALGVLSNLPFFIGIFRTGWFRLCFPWDHMDHKCVRTMWILYGTTPRTYASASRILGNINNAWTIDENSYIRIYRALVHGEILKHCIVHIRFTRGNISE